MHLESISDGASAHSSFNHMETVLLRPCWLKSPSRTGSTRALWRKRNKNVRMVLLDIFWHSSCRFYCGPEASGIVPSSMLSSIVCRQSSRPVKAFITSSLGPSSSCKNQQEDFEEPQDHEDSENALERSTIGDGETLAALFLMLHHGTTG